MYSLRGIRQGKGHFVAIYRRYVSRMSWFWQDSRVVYPKSPANRRFGMHHVKNLPGRGAFPVRDLQIIHSVKILPPLRSRSFSFAATLVPVLPRHRCPPYRTRFLAAPAAPACPSASQSPRLALSRCHRSPRTLPVLRCLVGLQLPQLPRRYRDSCVVAGAGNVQRPFVGVG